MKTYGIYFSSLDSELQENIAKENGYESAAELMADTNWNAYELFTLDVYHKGEEYGQEEPEAIAKAKGLA